MPRIKKSKMVEKPIPYYSKFDLTDKIEPFLESDRLTKRELNLISCSNQYQVERSLNSLNDQTLNDYLYNIYYSKKPSTAPLMRCWLSYFVKQHPTQIQVKVGDYLEPKKLSIEEWLCSVNSGRCRDILSVYMVSIATGVHTMVHLKDGKVWCTLKNDEMLEQCEKHLVYLGFGIYLRLVKREPLVVGTLTFNTLQTQQKFLQQAFTGMTGITSVAQKRERSKPTTAAGSRAQLARSTQVHIKQESEDKKAHEQSEYNTI